MINKMKKFLFSSEYKAFETKELEYKNKHNELENCIQEMKNEMAKMSIYHARELENLKKENEEKIMQLKEKKKSSPFNILSIQKRDETPFYDSKWTVVLSDKKSLKMHKIELVRRDTETEDKLEKEILGCASIDEVSLLDKKNSIYYD